MTDRRESRNTPVALVVSTLTSLLARDARGSEIVQTSFSYQASPTCPSGPEFARIVEQRAPALNLVTAPAPGADIVVIIRATEAAFEGVLRLRRPDGTDYVREITAPSCSELAPALAFVAALALRGQVEGPEQREVAPVDAPAPLPIAPAPPTPPSNALPRDPDSAGTVGWGASVGLGIRNGIAPVFAYTKEIDTEVRWVTGSVVAPRLRLGFLHGERVTRIDRAGTTDFSWMAARAAGCPVQLRVIDRVDALPCAGFDVGTVRASGTPSAIAGRGRDSSMLWIDAFVTARLQVRLIGPFFAMGEVELTFPLTNYRFEFDPGTPVYEVPRAAGAALAGVTAQIP
ncbi:MAG TPA: hypothetical protein VJT73_04645 [Polyangiaceae bacterium]|nr:hypothetical protein [Polyangiaceae bacterium]